MGSKITSKFVDARKFRTWANFCAVGKFSHCDLFFFFVVFFIEINKIK